MAAKDSGLRIRVQRELRDKFLDACRAQDKPAAQVLRDFMRTYIDRHDFDKGARPSKKKQTRRGLPDEH